MQSPPPQIAPSQIITRVRQELHEAQIESLIQSLTAKCFSKCVHKPSTALTSSEQSCIAKTMDRYQECMSLVFSTVARKAQ